MADDSTQPQSDRRARTDRRKEDDPAYPGPERRTGDRRGNANPTD